MFERSGRNEGFFILLVIGMLAVSFQEYPGGTIAVVAVPLAVFIAIKIAGKVIQRKRIQREREEEIENCRRENEKKEQEKQQKLLKQSELVERYKSSDQLVAILNYLCGVNENRKLPDTIKIDNEGILATRNGQSTYYSFVHHRIPVLPYAGGFGKGDFERYIVRPQVAMAEAINYRLSNEYEISDNANRTFKEYEDGITTFYASNYVIMKLKPKYTF